MRYIDLVLVPERGWFHRMDERIEAEPELSRVAIHQHNLLTDGTVTMLYELAGPEEVVDEVLESYEKVIAHQTSRLADNTLAYAHYEPSELVRQLLSIPQESGVVLEVPMVFTDDGGIRVTVVGSEVAIREAVDAIPDRVRVTVKRTGEYHPTSERLYAELTSRQQEILEVAVESGYYEEPRQTTQDRIAESVGCNAATVGEHLRKIESRVLTEILP